MSSLIPRRLTLCLMLAASTTMGCLSNDVDGTRSAIPHAALPELEVLSALVGRFAVTGETADGKLGALAPHYTGTFEGRWILHGNAVEVTTLGTGDNQGYQAKAIVSYDPQLAEFQSVAATSEGPGLSVRSKGTFDAATSTLTFERRHTSVDGSPVRVKFIHHFRSDGSFVLEMHSLLEEPALRSRYEHTPLP